MDHFICGFFGFWWWVKIFKKQIVEKKKMFLESFFGYVRLLFYLDATIRVFSCMIDELKFPAATPTVGCVLKIKIGTIRPRTTYATWVRSTLARKTLRFYFVRRVVVLYLENHFLLLVQCNILIQAT